MGQCPGLCHSQCIDGDYLVLFLVTVIEWDSGVEFHQPITWPATELIQVFLYTSKLSIFIWLDGHIHYGIVCKQPDWSGHFCGQVVDIEEEEAGSKDRSLWNSRFNFYIRWGCAILTTRCLLFMIWVTEWHFEQYNSAKIWIIFKTDWSRKLGQNAQFCCSSGSFSFQPKDTSCGTLMPSNFMAVFKDETGWPIIVMVYTLDIINSSHCKKHPMELWYFFFYIPPLWPTMYILPLPLAFNV